MVYVEITPRSVHRLLLAALRIATKAMEDHNWQHSRFAGVGGVAVASLTRLELSLCYLLDFKLFVSRDGLKAVARWMLKEFQAHATQEAGTVHVKPAFEGI